MAVILSTDPGGKLGMLTVILQVAGGEKNRSVCSCSPTLQQHHHNIVGDKKHLGFIGEKFRLMCWLGRYTYQFVEALMLNWEVLDGATIAGHFLWLEKQLAVCWQGYSEAIP